jgi:RNA polymerase sigma factor (sigma-70 family)
VRRSHEDELAGVAAIDDPMGRVALSNDVMTALKDLPTHLRIVIVLRYYADLSERDIATAIGRAPGTVKSRLSDARARLAAHPALQYDTKGESDDRQERHS